MNTSGGVEDCCDACVTYQTRHVACTTHYLPMSNNVPEKSLVMSQMDLIMP